MTDRFTDTLDRARDGDREALQELLDPHLPALTAFVRLRSGFLERRESCDDIVQSVCRHVMERLGAVRERNAESFRNWLFAAALNLLADKRDFHRAERRDVFRERPLVDSRVEESEVVRCYMDLHTPSQDAAAREEVRRFEAAFAKLPPDYRDVLVLAKVVGLPHGEVAARLGRSDAAVRQLLCRARARLATLLA